MSASTAPRFLLRRPNPFAGSRQTCRRNASTTQKASEAASDTASKLKSSTSSIQSKASEGLTRVTSAAGPALSGAAKGVSSTLGKIGGRTGRLMKAVESAIPPTVYYSKVGLELGKLVFQGQKMAPPSFQSFQSYFSPITRTLRNASSLVRASPAPPTSSSATNLTPEAVLSRIRNVDRTQLASAGVVLAEVLGFFTVGEMLGRMKIVGYRGEVHREH